MAFGNVGGFLRKLTAGTDPSVGPLVITTDSTDPLSVDSAVVTAQTKFSTADARNGLVQTQTETRGGLTRTVTYTRDTADGFISGISYGSWA